MTYRVAGVATDENGDRASFSNYGDNTDISAQGVNMLSTVPGGYAQKSGTSIAAPFVAGVVALLKQADYDLTPDEMEAILKETAYDVGEKGYDIYTGYGRVDPFHAVCSALSKYK